MDPNADEIKQLAQNQMNTTNITLNELLNTYAFDSVDVLPSYPSFPYMMLYSTKRWNLLPAVAPFQALDCIEHVEFIHGCIGPDKNIVLQTDEHSTLIIFSRGWGDCPAGCIHHEYWEFEIEGNEVRFLKNYET